LRHSVYLAKCIYSNSVRNVKVYPGVDVDSEHNPVVARVAVKLKRILRAKNRVKWNLGKLKDKDSYSSLEFRRGVDLAIEKLIERQIILRSSGQISRKHIGSYRDSTT